MRREEMNNEEMNNETAQNYGDVWVNEVTGERIDEGEFSFWLRRFAKRLGCGIALTVMAFAITGAFITSRLEQTATKHAAAEQSRSAAQDMSLERVQQLVLEERSVSSDARINKMTSTPLPSLEGVSKAIRDLDGSFKDLAEQSYYGEFLNYPEMKICTSGSQNAVSVNGSRVVFDPDVEYYIMFDYREALANDEDFRGIIRVKYPTFIPQGEVGLVQIIAHDCEHERYSVGEIEVYAKADDINLLHSAGVTGYSWSEGVETHWAGMYETGSNTGFGFSLYSSQEPTEVAIDQEDGISSVGGVVSYRIAGDDSGKLVSSAMPYYDTEGAAIELENVRTVSELRSAILMVAPPPSERMNDDINKPADEQPSRPGGLATEAENPEPPEPTADNGNQISQKSVVDWMPEASFSVDLYSDMNSD